MVDTSVAVATPLITAVRITNGNATAGSAMFSRVRGFRRLFDEGHIRAVRALVAPDSPTQRVGAPPSAKFQKVRHLQAMGSLEKVTTDEALAKWADDTRKRLGTDEPVAYVVEPKIDGFGIELTYQAGMLTLGATLVERVMAFPTPVVVACTGHAVAAGAFLPLAADARIGAGQTRIAADEQLRDRRRQGEAQRKEQHQRLGGDCLRRRGQCATRERSRTHHPRCGRGGGLRLGALGAQADKRQHGNSSGHLHRRESRLVSSRRVLFS